MNQHRLYSATLGLHAPWIITSISVDKESCRLDITIETTSDAAFSCPRCGCEAAPCETLDETWYHQDFFDYCAYIHARVPHVSCRRGCGISRVDVPWGRSGSRFLPLS